MKMRVLTGMGCAVLLFSLAAVAPQADDAAQEAQKAANRAEKAQVEATGGGVADLSLADQLARYGRENNNAVALALAAQIMAHVDTQEAADREPTRKPGEQSASGEGTKGADEAVTADSLRQEAAKIAEGNEALSQAITAIQGMDAPQKGRVGGPVLGHSDRVEAYATNCYNVTFRGDELATVYVSGDGDTDLDLRVYDEYGNLIAEDIDYSDECLVQWVPSWTGKFTICIENLGDVWNAYDLYTN